MALAAAAARALRLALLALVLLAPRGAGQAADARAQFERAAAEARALCAARPEDPTPRLQLATALHHLNDLAPDGGSRVPEAEAAYRAALRLAAPSAARAAASVRGNLGVLLLSAGRASEAADELAAALRAGAAAGAGGAELASSRFNLGKALAAAGRLPEAEHAYLEAARAAAGADASTYAKALAAAEALPDGAVAAAARAARAARRAAAGREGLGFLAALEAAWPADGREGGGGEEGGASSRGGGGSGSGSSGSGSSGAGSGGSGVDSSAGTGASARGGSEGSGGPDDAWLAGAPPIDLCWLHFALHKHEERVGRSAAAWAYLEAANRLMLAAAAPGRWDPRPERGTLRQIREIFPGPFESAPRPGDDSASGGGGGGAAAEGGGGAIFVVGAPRSGSTLIEQMLGAHTRIFPAGEDTRLAPLATEMAAALATAGDGGGAAAVARAYGGRYLSEMRARAEAGGAAGRKLDFLVDKMLGNIWRVGHILLMLPGRSCVIHAARHPLDAALSCYAQPFAHYSSVPWAWDLEDIASE
ncbi:hypothetical protein Rsub_13069, partial [Raphidocelis subcapitata]